MLVERWERVAGVFDPAEVSGDGDPCSEGAAAGAAPCDIAAGDSAHVRDTCVQGERVPGTTAGVATGADASGKGARTDWNELAEELMRASRSLHRHRGSGADAADIEMRGEINVLHALWHREALTAGELAQRCRVSSARMAKTLNQLEGRGVVVRERCATDRRRTIVHLTEAGCDELVRRSEGIRGYIAGVLRELGPADARELVRLAGRLSQVVDAHACESAGAGREEAGGGRGGRAVDDDRPRAEREPGHDCACGGQAVGHDCSAGHEPANRIAGSEPTARGVKDGDDAR
jgi:DNA-binding MarR family transcriptional regulator